MISKLKNGLHDIYLAQRFMSRNATKRPKLLEFLNTTHPVATEHALIRVGGDGDGGYLVPDDLGGIEICFSPGVSNKADFEEDLANRGIRCFLADYSVDAAPIANPLFDFEKKYLGSANTDVFMTLERWIDLKAPNGTDMILQMDIESAEYQVILDTSDEILKRFRILVIEFHRIDSLFVYLGWELINATFAKLLKHFDIVHIHPNNCCKAAERFGLAIPPVMEFTFLRKDRIATRQPRRDFPHALDMKTAPQRPDIVLPRCWYQVDGS